MTHRGFRLALAAALSGTLLATTGCGPEVQPAPPPPPPSAPVPVNSGNTVWVYQFIELAETGESADAESLDSATYGQLVVTLETLACCIDSVVAQFRAINPRWPVTGADIEAFLTHWCNVDVRTAIGFLFSRVPYAGLSALPVFNQVLSLLQATCPVDPAKLDWTSQQFVFYTVNNQRRLEAAWTPPALDSRRAAATQTIFGAVCAGLTGGLTSWVSGAIKSSRANFFVSIAIEAAMSACPSVLPQIL
jgi:hypothetical protein